MSVHGPFHRRGTPGGSGCRVSVIPVEARSPGGTLKAGFFADAGPEATELDLLRTVAASLGVRWGHDDLGWWAGVPKVALADFGGSEPDEPEPAHSGRHVLFREDDNGARFLIAEFDSRAEAEHRAAELAHGGHKQHYFIEAVPPADE